MEETMDLYVYQKVWYYTENHETLINYRKTMILYQNKCTCTIPNMMELSFNREKKYGTIPERMEPW